MQETSNLRQNQPLQQTAVSGSFNCYLCGYSYNRVGEPCMHYDIDEMDDEGEVSLCDECNKKVMEKAKTEKI